MASLSFLSLLRVLYHYKNLVNRFVGLHAIVLHLALQIDGTNAATKSDIPEQDRPDESDVSPSVRQILPRLLRCGDPVCLSTVSNDVEVPTRTEDASPLFPADRHFRILRETLSVPNRTLLEQLRKQGANTARSPLILNDTLINLSFPDEHSEQTQIKQQNMQRNSGGHSGEPLEVEVVEPFRREYQCLFSQLSRSGTQQDNVKRDHSEELVVLENAGTRSRDSTESPSDQQKRTFCPTFDDAPVPLANVPVPKRSRRLFNDCATFRDRSTTSTSDVSLTRIEASKRVQRAHRRKQKNGDGIQAVSVPNGHFLSNREDD
ncbi:unnamed protein product [Amoebophrya sp. A25]|nr:unnamed protein product [Amoebophrya sp. A25]|eukprot:GSA25T00026774001.1